MGVFLRGGMNGRRDENGSSLIRRSESDCDRNVEIGFLLSKVNRKYLILQLLYY